MYVFSLNMCFRSSTRPAPNDMLEIQRIYRIYQVFHGYSFDFQGKISLQLLCIGQCSVIASTYMIIKMPAEFGLVFGICVFAAAIFSNVITMINIMDMSAVTVASVQFSRLMPSPENNQLSKYDDRFFKSSYPIYFKMQDFFVVSESTVVTVYHDIIYTSVIDLLLLKLG